jgi:cyclic dehypoxanthinyl futalosine synthase
LRSTSARSGQSPDAGLKTTATMVIGFDEDIEERLSIWSALDNFRTKREGWRVSCWTFKPYFQIGGIEISTPSTCDILRDRIYLANIPRIVHQC